MAGGFFLRLRYLTMGLVVGAFLGVGGLFMFQQYHDVNVFDELRVAATSVVFEHIQAQNELVSASQQYNITERASSTNKIPFTNVDIPFTENSYWYRYVGTIKASVNLAKAEFAADGNKVTVSIDKPAISSNTPDMEKSCVLEEHNNVLNPISIEDVDNFRKKCMEQSEAEAIEGGLLNEAQTNAEKDIKKMLTDSLGDDCKVDFKWREA